MNLSLRKTFNANQNSRARTLSFGVDSSEQHHATAFPPMAHQSQSSSGPDWSYLVGCLFPAPSPEWFSGVSEKKKDTWLAQLPHLLCARLSLALLCCCCTGAPTVSSCTGSSPAPAAPQHISDLFGYPPPEGPFYVFPFVPQPVCFR